MKNRPKIVIAIITLAVAVLAASSAGAADDPGVMHEAGKHFQRGVALYGEADYRAALVEFKRAYATSPNVAVLYNVGETEYQLQDYASALTTFERYLTEAGASEPHRAEVEGTVDVLRARVGHLTVSTTPPGAEITVDDVSVGRTPFDKTLLVSIGRRKIVATIAGRAPVSRFVDVAADDTVPIALVLQGADSSPSTMLSFSSLPKVETASPSGSAGATLRTIGWITTGASVAGAATFGILAMKSSSDLQSARAAYPTTSATLSSDASLTTTYSILADSLTAAAILVGGITLYSTLSSSSGGSKRGSTGTTHVSLGPGSARFEMTF